MSASSMWTANAATVSPGADTADGRVHFTPANLVSQFHRTLESTATARLLSRTQAEVRGACSVLQINFNSRIQYQSHFPLDTGDEVFIKVRVIEPDREAPDREQITERASIPRSLSGRVSQIALNFNGPNVVILHIRFAGIVGFRVAQGRQLNGIAISFQDPGAEGDCPPSPTSA